jgi:hypothetical protein
MAFDEKPTDFHRFVTFDDQSPTFIKLFAHNIRKKATHDRYPYCLSFLLQCKLKSFPCGEEQR